MPPSFPPLGPLPADALPLDAKHRAYVDALPEHKRFEAEWTLRAVDAAFARAVRDRITAQARLERVERKELAR